MKAIAFVPVYNEADILPWTLRHLRSQGVEPYVIDNWSDDRTDEAVLREAATPRDGAPSTGMSWERFPADGPSATYDWTAILHHIEELAAASDADWCMLQDADELRYSPWPSGVMQRFTLNPALELVQDKDFSAVNFQCYNFVPTEDGWDGTQDPEEYFQFIEPDSIYSRVPHIKAWRNVGRVDLASTGGHEARFEGRRVFTTPFVSKHYGIRSQAHGERKVFRDRVPRWNPEERAKRWHEQYLGIEPGHNFIRKPEELARWNAA